MTVIGLSLGIFYLVRWIQKMPVSPDPWESEITPEELGGNESPVCVNCLAPVLNPTQHYCPVCGNVTGDFTRYIPFLNIRFNYSLFATLWAKLKSPDARLITKMVALIPILLLAPLMLGVGLPVLLYCRLRRKPNEQVLTDR